MKFLLEPGVLFVLLTVTLLIGMVIGLLIARVIIMKEEKSNE